MRFFEDAYKPLIERYFLGVFRFAKMAGLEEARSAVISNSLLGSKQGALTSGCPKYRI
jgi:hypothetical protein